MHMPAAADSKCTRDKVCQQLLTRTYRDFLLFMPAHLSESKLHAVMTYYNAVVSVSPEGDSSVSDETLEGLGTDGSSRSLFNSLFGSLYRVAFPMPPKTPSHSSSQPQSVYTSIPPPPTSPAVAEGAEQRSGATVTPTLYRNDSGRAAEAGPLAGDYAAGQDPARPDHGSSRSGLSSAQRDYADYEDEELSDEGYAASLQKKKFKLTDFAPDPGYFLAGAIAGGVSRTATAPLDRLKVYLLVSTSSGSETAAGAMKAGKPIQALKNGLRPFGDAIRDLYNKGGLRGFFAGQYSRD